MNQMKPLEGIKVIDLTVYAAAPATGRMLADWGAEVIKVEPLRGDPMRTFGAFMSTPIEEGENPCWEIDNANKKSIPINLKDPKGIEIMDQLLAEADIFITNNRTAALENLGLDYETVSKKHPHIVWGQINGFGDRGPAAAKPGFDTVAYWARSGTMIDITEKGTPPITAPIAFGDHNTACSLAAGVCAALVKQKVTGKGDKVLVSLFSQAIWNAGILVQSTQYGIDTYQKSRKTDVNPLANSYQCKDGEWIFITILEHERYWETLCKALEIDEFINDKRFSTLAEVQKQENREALTAKLDEVFATKDQSEWVEILEEADIAHDRIQHFKDIAKDEQAIMNGYMYEHEFRNGNKIMAASPPVKFGDEIAPDHKHAPLLGENTIDIMKDLNYNQEQIDELINAGVLKSL